MELDKKSFSIRRHITLVLTLLTVLIVLLIGVCVAAFQALPQIDPAWRLALVTGFLGALTTFSSFSAEVVTMLQQQRYLLAAGTTGLHLGGSLLMTLLGLQTVALALASRP